MTSLESVFARAAERRGRLVMIDQEDGSIERAAELLREKGVDSVTLVGQAGIDPATDPRLGEIAGILRDCWPERVRDGIHALDLAAHPLLFAAGLTALGHADVCLAGTAVPMDAVEEAARWILGPDRNRVRGHLAYLLTMDDRLSTLAIPDSAGPLDARAMAELVMTAAGHRTRVVGDQPRVGFLVPPPSQDASHADAEVALNELRTLAPGIAASVEWGWTTQSEGTESGRFRSGPNVLIFPDPVSGHVAQLVLRDTVGRKAWGPLFPGGRWTLAGVPEGASPSDIVAVAALALAGGSGA
ncbi:MAG: hypothetical protein ACYC2K_17470 [Gemmatimonadales bacterium]